MVNYNSYYNSSMDSNIINPNKYNLDKLKSIKHHNSSLFKSYSNLLYSATRYNPRFAKDYLNSLWINSQIDASSLLFYKEIESHIYGQKPNSVNKIKYRIKDIFADHWDDYVNEFSNRMTIPQYVFENVERMINCRTLALGYSTYECNNCPNYKIVFHTCKSRFCSSCGIQYAKDRSINISKKVFNKPHRHLVFTIPDELRNYFKKDRSLLDILFDSSKEVIEYLFNGRREYSRVDKSRAYSITPGFISVVHTFGRDLKFNPHIHMVISEGGIDSRTDEFTGFRHFNYNLLRKSWQKLLLDALHKRLGKSFFPMKSKQFRLHRQGFYVYAPQDKSKDTKDSIDYVIRYTGRPVMAESRITNYDGEFVTYWYNPHENEDETVTVREHAFKFIGKLIAHIPIKNYKTVRYYGTYAAKNHRFKNKVQKLYTYSDRVKSNILRYWRMSIINSFRKDPLRCECGSFMEKNYSYFPPSSKGGAPHEIFWKERFKKPKLQNWEQFTKYSPPN